MADEKNSSQENEARKSGTGEKSLIKRLTPYLAFGVLLLSFIGYLVDVPQKIIDIFDHRPETNTVDSNSSHPSAINFFGVVRFAGTNDPVAGAAIHVKPKKEAKISLGQGTTDSKGEFNFKIKARPDDAVWVVVIKDKWPGFEGFLVPKADKTIPFKKKP